ncbi:MAG: permease [Anaerolineae bacterium]
MEQLTFVGQFIWENFLHIWPYLLVTIPLAVAVNLSGASKQISRAFQASPLVAIVLATAVGAFSPFCSCSVIPVVASLLIGGVPLAPVMSFWIASPSMDPEIFFLSVSVLGWELALWRLVGTLILSLSAGLLTHFLMQQGWLGTDILRQHRQTSVRSTRQLLQDGWQWLRQQTAVAFTKPEVEMTAVPATISLASIPVTAVASPTQSGSCGGSGGSCSLERPSFRQRLIQETWAATRLVVQFMALAFLLEALIMLFVPETWIVGLLGEQNRWAVPLAALLGVPVYTSNLTALPVIGGLLAQGMNPAAALAFLIAGPTTTLPAMAAVWGLVRRRVFVLYVSLALVGAMVLGTVYALILS